jgi:hypothetical protein
MIPLLLMPFLPTIKNVIIDIAFKKGSVSEKTFKGLYNNLSPVRAIVSEKDFVRFCMENQKDWIGKPAKQNKPRKVTTKKKAVKKVKKTK